MSKPSIAKTLGKGLAYFQDTVDLAVQYGFHKLRKVKIDDQNEPSPRKEVKKVTKGILHFLGEVGDTFYREYEKLKQRRERSK